jgi:2-octaprenyl-6-methoxyphenol hydroxylase
MRHEDTDILIAGGGVAGLAAAAALGAEGFSLTLVDPAPPVTDEGAPGADLRTTALLQPARALLDRAGVWDRLLPHGTPLQVMRIVDAAVKPPVTRDFDAADIGADPFGWNFPNWLLRRELLARLADLPNVRLLTSTGFAAATPRDARIIVRLSDGRSIAARLLIGADGRDSAVRRGAGIGVRAQRSGQKALVFAVHHILPHHNISTEVHRDGGPFTLVPLPDRDGMHRSAVVWMAEGPRIAALAVLDDADFAVAATERSAGVMGPLTLAGPRQVWPILAQVADRLTAPRTALVAEAAHVMPPIGAQGLNLSLTDIATLRDLALARPEGLGEPAMLAAYARARGGDILLRTTGVAALNRASITGLPALQQARAAGVRLLHDVAPLRRLAMRMGLGAGRGP